MNYWVIPSMPRLHNIGRKFQIPAENNSKTTALSALYLQVLTTGTVADESEKYSMKKAFAI